MRSEGLPTRRSAVAGWLFGVLLLAALVTFVLRRGDIAEFGRLLRSLQPRWFAAAAMLQVLSQSASGLVWYYVFSYTSRRVAFWPLMRVRLAMVFANEALPSAGLAGSVVAINGLAPLGVPAHVVVTAILAGVMTTYVAGAIALMAAFVALQPYHHASPRVIVSALIFSGVAVAAFVAFTWRRDTLAPTLSARVAERMPRVAAALDSIAAAPIGPLRDAGFLLRTTALSLAVMVCDCSTLFVLLTAVGAGAPARAVFGSFMVATAATGAIPLPGNLGAFEAALVGMLHVVGSRVEPALAAALLLRGFTVWLPMIPGFWYSRKLGRPA